MDIQTLQVICGKITTILMYAIEAIAALLALDNAVDALAKFFGNKQIDTLCGKLALYLNGLMSKLKGFQPPPSTPPSGAPAVASAIVPATTGATS